jgi:hypothetical protein
MSDTKTVSRCPACGQVSFVDHCENRICTWMQCRNKECDLVLDVRTKRGHKLGPVSPSTKLRPRVTWVGAA